MQPVTSSPDLSSLTAAWECFVHTAQPPTQADPLVFRSWKRSAPLLNAQAMPRWAYLSDDVLPLTLQQHELLCSLARPLMEDVHQSIENTDAFIALTDATACLLDVLGDFSALDFIVGLGMRQGAFLDEARTGTHAFSVALAEGTSAYIVGPEHYLQCFHPISSVAAPIHDAEGRPLGAIGIISTLARSDPHLLGTVVAMAKAIESQLRADWFVREANARATELNGVLDAMSDGVLAWTANDLVTHLNDRAGQLLGLSPAAVVGRRYSEFMQLPPSVAQAARRNEVLNDAEIHIEVNDRPHECLASLRTVSSEGDVPATHILTLKPIEQVRRLVQQLLGAQARLTLDDIVGHGLAARRIRKQALKAAAATGSVVLMGENGTGKNSLARVIHNSGPRASGPFLAINCRALPSGLAVSELLGIESVASGQPSKFELAHGGTLFLEDIDALPLDAQSALLNILETGEVIRLGGTRVIPVDVRVIAASDLDLEVLGEEGAFRADLFFRLSAFVMALPPLRERPEDIPLFLERLLARLRAQLGHALSVTPEAKAVLCTYPWPGNVRELEAMVERAALRSEGGVIDLADLPEALRSRRAKVPRKVASAPVRGMLEAERDAILTAGRAAQGNMKQTAQLLGIGRTTLWRKMKDMRLSIEDFGGG
jgi:transcriptional activator for dhaKLM operon